MKYYSLSSLFISLFIFITPPSIHRDRHSGAAEPVQGGCKPFDAPNQNTSSTHQPVFFGRKLQLSPGCLHFRSTWIGIIWPLSRWRFQGNKEFLERHDSSVSQIAHSAYLVHSFQTSVVLPVRLSDMLLLNSITHSYAWACSVASSM
jgi:hypothetical protein